MNLHKHIHNDYKKEGVGVKELLDIGFEKAGAWTLEAGNLKLNITKFLSENNILYAFIVDGEVKYIGKTTQTLLKRMGGYKTPGATQATNIKNNANLLNSLNEGKTVDIYVLPDNGLMHYGIFHLNLSAGLEDSIIQTLAPDWNRSATINKNSEQTVSSSDLSLFKDGEHSLSLVLHKTYYKNGFFNIPIKHSHHFGNDGERIEIFLDDDTTTVLGTINRTANNNQTPRIMGLKLLARWFQANKKPMDRIIVEILTPNAIKIK